MNLPGWPRANATKGALEPHFRYCRRVAATVTRGTLDVGMQLAGTYTIEGLIGAGGMGSVYLASHARLPGKRVAIKVLNAAVRDADTLTRFRREAQIASKLGHPNIVDVLDFNTLDDGSPFLVLEFLEGESLADRMARGPMELSVTLSVARQIGSALAAAHRAGVVHRDLKPQNIFLVPTEVDGCSTEIAKVFDFGVSKILDSFTVQTQDNQMLGTPQYMSPEQATGRSADIDGRSDQFALAVIVHEMLSGKPAFAGNSVPSLLFNVVYEQPAALELAAPNTPAQVVGALARAMQKDRTLRYATMEDFVRELTGVTLPASRSVSVNILSSDDESVAVAVPVSMVTVNARPPNTTPVGQVAWPAEAAAEAATPAANRSAAPNAALPRRRLFPAIVGAVGLAAIGGIVLLVVNRDHLATPTATTPVVQVREPASLDAAPARNVAVPDATTSVAAKILDAGNNITVDATAATPSDGKTATADRPIPGPRTNRTTATTTANAAQPSAEQQQTLASAIAALAAGNNGEARRLALIVLDTADISASQRSRAIALLLEVACRNNKISEAATWYRQLSGSWRSKLKTQCAGLGVELE